MQLSSPLLILALVYVSLVAASEIGFRVGRGRQSRTEERRLLLVLVVQPLLVALVITVIADMDRPFRGWLRVSKNPLVRAQESMH